MLLDKHRHSTIARGLASRSAAANTSVISFALRARTASNAVHDRRERAMMRVQTLRVGQAVAHGVASFLGLGSMPWLATYVIGRNLAQRLTNAWPSIKR